MELMDRVILVLVLMLSLGIHEFAHAWTAYRLGDDTAARLGRLTLNPLAHADLLGTVVLPLLGVPFGWARPVPVNPYRFRSGVNLRLGLVVTAAAGPLANVLLFFLAVLVIGLTLRFQPEFFQEHRTFLATLDFFCLLNAILALFNLLPIPPLDGSRVADGLIQGRFRSAWEGWMRVGPLVLVALLVVTATTKTTFLPIQSVNDLAGHMVLWIAGGT